MACDAPYGCIILTLDAMEHLKIGIQMLPLLPKSEILIKAQ